MAEICLPLLFAYIGLFSSLMFEFNFARSEMFRLSRASGAQLSKQVHYRNDAISAPQELLPKQSSSFAFCERMINDRTN